jgi:cystathionine gamma-synthase
LAERLAGTGIIHPEDPLLPTEATAVDLCHFLKIDRSRIVPVESIWSVRLPDDPGVRKECRAFLQHTGCGLSSREAETILERQFNIPAFKEARSPLSPEENYARIRSSLHQIYGTAAETDIHLFRSGMNAFYTGFRALQAIQLNEQRDLWIQLGWLYVDTSRILERFALPPA